MNRIGLATIFVLLFGVLNSCAQDAARIHGHWEGAVDVMGQHLPIAVDFTERSDSLMGTIDIQDVKGMKLASVRMGSSSDIHFELPTSQAAAIFDGKLSGDSITGTFRQGSAAGSFSLRSGATGNAQKDKREKLPYREEEVRFNNGEITLAGTLTIPPSTGRHPVVVMISGSGQQNRDEEIFGFKAFRIIADHLTRQGIAVLRYDDRGVGSSGGDPATSTTGDFALDAEAAVAFLKKRPDIDPEQIGIIGHSEGGAIAPMIAARSRDVAFIVLLAGPAISGAKTINSQIESMQREAGSSRERIDRTLQLQEKVYATLQSGQGWDELEAALMKATREEIDKLPPEQKSSLGSPDAYVRKAVAGQLEQIRSPWFKFFVEYDPSVDLAKVEIPVLALFGEFDTQVPVALNREPMEEALKRGGNRDYTIEIVPGANHLFLRTTTGSPNEYASMKKEFVPGFLDALSRWTLRHVRRVE